MRYTLPDLHFVQYMSRIRSLHVAWVRRVGLLCVAATAATAAGPRGETHFRKRL